MLKRMLLTLFSVSAGVLVSAGGAHAADYYVSAAGSNTFPGTAALPWKTIQKAADTALAGDTVYIRGGLYPEIVSFNRHAGTAAAPIRFVNFPGETPLIATPDWAALYVYNGSDWIIFDGLAVTGADYHGIAVIGASHVVIQNCESYGNGWAGIFIGAAGEVNQTGISMQDNQVLHCRIHDNAHEGVYLKSGWATETVTGLVVEDNLIYGNGDEGIQNTYWEQSPYNPSPPSGTAIRGNTLCGNGCDWGVMDLMGDDLVVENNRIFDNVGKTADPGLTNDVGITYQHGRGLVARNNILSRNTTLWSSSALFYLEACGEVRILNNTLCGTNQRGVRIYNPTGPIILTNNIFAQIGGMQVVGAGGETVVDYNLFDRNDGTVGANARIGDPRFADPAGRDFRLLSGSPAIDAGLDLGDAVRRDIDGVYRPQGATYDLGAHEYFVPPPGPPGPPRRFRRK